MSTTTKSKPKAKDRAAAANRGRAAIERVTNDLIAAIEAGAGDWHMPWTQIGSLDTPRSIDGRLYRGLNVLILHFTALDRGYTSGVWGTYKAWAAKGGQVRKGETATEVVLWRPYTRKKEDEDGEKRTERGLAVRTFRVFNAHQQDGWEIPTVAPRNTDERIAHCEAFFAAINAMVLFGGDRAGYSKAADSIVCPALEQFDTAPHFYSTLGHEHVHWTGHDSRLKRDLSGRFGSDAYGAEELVAELGAALLCAQLGIDAANRQDHAAYLASWLRVLKQDPSSLVTVMSKAQAAVDYLNTAAGDEPADEADED